MMHATLRCWPQDTRDGTTTTPNPPQWTSKASSSPDIRSQPACMHAQPLAGCSQVAGWQAPSAANSASIHGTRCMPPQKSTSKRRYNQPTVTVGMAPDQTSLA